MKKEILYWNQSVHDNILETVMMVLVIAFLYYVVKLAFFEKDD
ncbi:hypothetical protein [Neisseria canis]|uniref:Uncharacterized protein n=1 Tax=Neisseria canis TaxID=493 RepID=A0A448D8I1_9NEIS|nr:hypothetical protein [Neisseria canis]VEF01528.1 Uncharacterised protein [Neisseria canis]